MNDMNNFRLRHTQILAIHMTKMIENLHISITHTLEGISSPSVIRSKM